MQENIIVRKAEKNEIKWINTQYDLVGFKRSNYDNELICIIEVDGQKAALGRLQKIEDDIAELGGIYVCDNFRGMRLASKIVSFLVKNSKNYKKVYCLPFGHLSNFYKKYGFIEDKNNESVHKVIKDKHHWCNKTYQHQTLLFVLENQP